MHIPSLQGVVSAEEWQFALRPGGLLPAGGELRLV